MNRKALFLCLCPVLLAGVAWHFSGPQRQAVLNKALVTAVQEGRAEDVDALIREGADVRTRNNLDESLVFSAEGAGNARLLLALAQAGLPPDELDAGGLTILHRAARRGDTELLREILALGLPIDALDHEGRSPLSHALRAARFPGAYVLMEHGARLRPDAGGEAPLISLLVGNAGSVPPPNRGSVDPDPRFRKQRLTRAYDMLARRRPKPGTERSRRQENAAWLSCVRILLQSGAAADARDEKGRSAVEIAVAEHRWKTASLLVQHLGGWRDPQGRTLLHLAATRGDRRGVEALYGVPGRPKEKPAVELLVASWVGDLPRVRALLAAGVDPNAPSIPGTTALIKAAGRGNTPVVAALLQHRARPQQAAGGETPLTVAAAICSPDVVDLLLRTRAPINARSADGTTPLHAALRVNPPGDPADAMRYFETVAMHRIRTIRSLLDHGADTNALDGSGVSPLRIALASRGSSPVQMLLDHGARTRDDRPEPPLFAAVERGTDNDVRSLLDLCVNVNERSLIDGATPLWRATVSRNLQVMEVLCNYGGRLPKVVYWPPVGRRMRVVDILRTWPPFEDRMVILRKGVPGLERELASTQAS